LQLSLAAAVFHLGLGLANDVPRLGLGVSLAQPVQEAGYQKRPEDGHHQEEGEYVDTISGHSNAPCLLGGTARVRAIADDSTR
jgi:hypothetical protein